MFVVRLSAPQVSWVDDDRRAWRCIVPYPLSEFALAIGISACVSGHQRTDIKRQRPPFAANVLSASSEYDACLRKLSQLAFVFLGERLVSHPDEPRSIVVTEKSLADDAHALCTGRQACYVRHELLSEAVERRFTNELARNAE
ncbi:hypothetical protein WL26_24030 [Burkholderia cepacia]|nr:hypothetical protein WL26_24030 [Burkholderia cepacia]